MSHLSDRATPALHSPSQSCTPANSGLAHLPGSHGDALPGPFYSRVPLAGTGPSLALFLAGWGQGFRAVWPTPSDLFDDLIGGVCAFALPSLLLFGAFLK